MFSNRLFNLLVPLISVLLGFLAGAIIMLIFGYNPIAGYSALISGAFGNSYAIGETVRQITPLMLTGIGIAFAFRTGLFNIGAEGQVLVGWLASVWVGISFDLPAVLHIPLALLAAAVAGALWASVPGILKALRGVHEVVISIMMNYIALHTCNYIIRNYLSNNGDKSEVIAETASLRTTWLYEKMGYSQIHWGFIIAIVAVIAMWFILEKTTTGYELRSVGFNRHAANYAGMNVKKNIIKSMMISGVFAGLAGAMEGLGTFGHMHVHGSFTNLGFDGIAVALLGANTAMGSFFSAILFGSLKMGALRMPTVAGVPSELVEIVIASIIFFIASSYIIRWVLLRLKKEEN
ncbi:ABC transporter permease [Amphibacillus sp. MSJ-3]|uniref:ABC transporter permease n=1 Tax=Amphibacillus sp. MSJ-3 TaxID=2841505 RepID=UPI001C0EC362|nr:ABC transporter permease [Amphibacillus sp. MSJ-3]MBU5595064.1 ABC transporter permease [Amphibacillus sp. MSJ-3]